MINKKTFFKAFLKNPKQVGSVIQSSAFLARKIVRLANVGKAKCVVELGAGTGAVTRRILKEMPANAVLICFEVDKSLCKEMKKNIKDERLKIISDSAEKMDRYLGRFGQKKADAIISELPLVSLSKAVGDVILDIIVKNLKPKGKYVQIQYSLLSKKRIKKVFPNMKVTFEPLNIPPSFIYVCEKE